MALQVTETHNSRVTSTAVAWLNQKPLPQIFSGNLLLGTLLGQESRANKMTFPLKAGRVKRQGGGREFRVRVRYKRSTNVTSFRDLDELSTNLDDIHTIAKANCAYYTDFAGQSWQEAIENDGAEKEFDLLEERMENALDTLKERIDTDLMSTGDGVSVGNNGKNIIGLNHTLSADPTTGTVWGLDRSVYTWWRHNLITAGDTFANVGVAKLANAFATQSGTSGEDPPTLLITTKAQWLAYHAVIAALQQIQTIAVSSGGEQSGDAGFPALMFMNRPIVYHAGQTANVWMALNLNYFYVFLRSKAQFAVMSFQGDAKQLVDSLSRIVFGAQVGCERFDRQARVLYTG